MKKEVLLDDVYILQEFFNSILENDFKMSLALRLDMLKEEIKPHYERVERFRSSLVQKYGEQDKDNPQMFQIKDENKFLFVQEFGELLSQKIELNTQGVKMDDLENVNIKFKHFPSLKRLLSDEVKVETVEAVEEKPTE